MATFVKFSPFVEHLAEGVHNLGSNQLVVALTNTAPTAATDDTLADIVEITYTNLSSRNITTSTSAQTSGAYKLVLADLVLTASGSVGPFRYAVIYNDTPTSPADPLIGYYDYGSAITLASGETLTLDFDATNGVIQLAEGGAMSSSRHFTKDPAALLPYKFDWRAATNGSGTSDWLAVGETITSYIIIADAGITVDSDALADSNTSVKVWLDGGTLGESYAVTCSIVTSAANEDERTIIVRIIDK